MTGDQRADVTRLLADLEAAAADTADYELDAMAGEFGDDYGPVVLARAASSLIAAVRAGLALADELEADRGGYHYAVRNGLVPGPWDRLRAALTAPLAGQPTTDEETDRG